MTLYKCTRAGGLSTHAGDYAWDRPRGRRPGKWQPPIAGELVPCENGYHLCRAEHLIDWLNDELWVAETKDPEPLDGGDKVVVRTARLVSRVETWNERTARLFAADCAERVLPIFERERPGDDRPRLAIEAARAFARGEIDAAARAAAVAAARAAAWAAERQWQTARLLDYLEGRAS